MGEAEKVPHGRECGPVHLMEAAMPHDDDWEEEESRPFKYPLVSGSSASWTRASSVVVVVLGVVVAVVVVVDLLLVVVVVVVVVVVGFFVAVLVVVAAAVGKFEFETTGAETSPAHALLYPTRP